MKSVQELTTEKTALETELAEAQREVAALEVKGATTPAALASHSKARSRADIIARRRQEIEVEIRAARRAELQAKVETLQAAYLDACRKRETVQREIQEKLAPWYDYPGGGMILKVAVAGTQPLREQIFSAMALSEELRRAVSTLHDMA